MSKAVAYQFRDDELQLLQVNCNELEVTRMSMEDLFCSLGYDNHQDEEEHEEHSYFEI